ncbi:protein SUPPRESSOR OF GENE SILENCING 3-like [Cucurbita moschata]|uniref:Protein SUPPRESSOR OF GENE SILENCING 3-like n=1 Tax=Cucurbita moschata TaxID=3662 RepID=A0A6J1G6W6_CUCMO|nr:protein SUPPRESSOR OF GENE SILENCING 3-like [Cucurbita moschata]
MSSTRGRGKSFNSGTNNEKTPKASNVSEISTTPLDHLSQGVADVSLDSGHADGDWEVYAKKSRNKAGTNATKQWGAQYFSPKLPEMSQTSGTRNGGGRGKVSSKNWQPQYPDTRKMGRGNAWSQSRASESNYVAPQSVICPPLEHGWNWQSRAGSSQTKVSVDAQHKVDFISNSYPSDENEESDNAEDNDNDSDDLEDSDDDLLSDDFDSDASQKSYETRKKIRWFKKFFEILDSLTVDEINEPARQWHCPACQGGPGAIDWYRGLQPLMAHAKTKGSKRVKLHRELAELLDEELRRKGASIVPAGELFGKWKGLKDEEKDHEIVWPPMVIIMNTKLEQDVNEKWIGMGNPELLDYFSPYDPKKARHSYGPQGHRGMSALIFEPSARGYLNAERLHKHFIEQGTDRDAWDSRRRTLFYPGGKRQLYGFMAIKDDLDTFNQHMQGKSKMKFEMKSYQEMVVDQIKQMSEDNQQLTWLKYKVVKERSKSKAYEESLDKVCEKLRKTTEENRIVRQRTLMQHEEDKEEMQLQEQFFKEQMELLHKTREETEENFERMQQEEREKVKKQTNASHSTTDEYRSRAKEVAKFIKFQEKEMEDFVAEREELIKVHEEKMAAMKRRHWDEEVEVEKEFNAELTRLMEKYSPQNSKDAAEVQEGMVK